MKRIGLLSGIFLIGAILFGCAPKSAPIEKSTTPESLSPEGQITGKQTWQLEWEKTLAEAKKEGKIVIRSTMPPEANGGLQAAFKAKTGISIEIETGGKGGAGAERTVSEQRTGLYLVDLIFDSGDQTEFGLKPAGAITPRLDKYIFMPEILDSKFWYENQFPWWDEERNAVYLTLSPSTPLAVNTSLVNPEEIKSYWDLLKPKWKGKIVFLDPTRPGQGQQWFSVYGRDELLGLDFMRSLAKQEPMVTIDKRLTAEWTAKGKYAISLATGWILFGPFREAGAPVSLITTQEADYLSAASAHLSLAKNAPHPAASRLFLNWILSREGGLALQKAYERQVPRVDTGTIGLEGRTDAIRVDGKKYFNAAKREHLYLKRDIYDPLSKEIFGPLLR